MDYIDNPEVRSRVKGIPLKIGQVAREAGVTVDAVRFYERVGVLPPPPRRPSGYREYDPKTIDRIKLTRELQALGLSLGEVVDALTAHDAGGATCSSERWRLDAVLGRVDAKIAELITLRRRIITAEQACNAGRCQFSNRQPSQPN